MTQQDVRPTFRVSVPRLVLTLSGISGASKATARAKTIPRMRKSDDSLGFNPWFDRDARQWMILKDVTARFTFAKIKDQHIGTYYERRQRRESKDPDFTQSGLRWGRIVLNDYGVRLPLKFRQDNDKLKTSINVHDALERYLNPQSPPAHFYFDAERGQLLRKEYIAHDGTHAVHDVTVDQPGAGPVDESRLAAWLIDKPEQSAPHWRNYRDDHIVEVHALGAIYQVEHSDMQQRTRRRGRPTHIRNLVVDMIEDINADRTAHGLSQILGVSRDERRSTRRRPKTQKTLEF